MTARRKAGAVLVAVGAAVAAAGMVAAPSLLDTHGQIVTPETVESLRMSGNEQLEDCLTRYGSSGRTGAGCFAEPAVSLSDAGISTTPGDVAYAGSWVLLGVTALGGVLLLATGRRGRPSGPGGGGGGWEPPTPPPGDGPLEYHTPDLDPFVLWELELAEPAPATPTRSA